MYIGTYCISRESLLLPTPGLPPGSTEQLPMPKELDASPPAPVAAAAAAGDGLATDGPTAAADGAAATPPPKYPPTRALYLDDSYRFECGATCIGASRLESGGWALVLDETIFHPQGGGQPADRGSISVGEGDAKRVFALCGVSKCRVDGVIMHELSEDTDPRETDPRETSPRETSPRAPPITVGDRVNLNVDEAHRRLNARLHSAGHLIDVAMKAAGCSALEPAKGYHYSPGSYVEYGGKLSQGEREALRPQLQALTPSLHPRYPPCYPPANPPLPPPYPPR